MPSRKWMVRGLVFSVVVCVAGAGLLYQRWTNPAAVRRQVLEHLNKHFVGANVTIESAHMRLFGGIAVRELRMSRRDDTDHTDFAYIPNAVIYHDKEKMLDGELNIRKIELYKPRIRVTRFRDGSWNLAGVLGPVDLNRSIPTIVIQQGTIIVEDRQAAIGTPPVEIKDVDLTVVNDPRPTLVFHGTGKPETGGTIQVSGKLQRKSADTAVTVEAARHPSGAGNGAEIGRPLSGTGRACPATGWRRQAEKAEGRAELSSGQLRSRGTMTCSCSSLWTSSIMPACPCRSTTWRLRFTWLTGR